MNKSTKRKTCTIGIRKDLVVVCFEVSKNCFDRTEHPTLDAAKAYAVSKGRTVFNIVDHTLSN